MEIAYFLKDSIQKATKIMLWQNINGTRHIWYGRLLFIDQNKAQAILVINQQDKSFDINAKSTLYVKGEFESVLFKSHIRSVNETAVKIDLPEMAYLYEKRKFERFQFKDETNSIMFSRSNEGYSHRNRFLGNVLDISRQGLTLIIQPNMAQNWSPEDSLNIYRISDKKLSQPIKAEIIYIKPIRNFRNNRMYLKYRFGLRFSSEMNRIQISSIAKKKSKKVA